MHKGKAMLDLYKEDMDYIPRGNAPQSDLSMFYWPMRMNSLGKKAEAPKTRGEVLIEAINAVRKSYQDFVPK
ncbi:MAG: hypothetical protein M0Q13_09850 [Methanothrix sp.]|jgi:hypothetical protein|nr:hypothetical protein [Methanothrix sp.]